jgi:KDO2-lipid IV(A) lauroyltransferase
VEYALLRLVESCSRILGPRRAFALGARAGRLAYRLMGGRRRLACRNLWRALPALGRAWPVEPTIRGCFEHFAGSLLEAMAASHAPARLLRDGVVRFTGLERARRALEGGRGAVAVIAHQGNWELAGVAATQLPLPIVSVARPVHNPLLDAYLERARARTGQRIVVNRGTIHQLVEILGAGAMLIIPTDQWPKRGPVVEFLGRPTYWLRTPAVLALKTGAPVLPIRIRREAAGRHAVELTEPIDPAAFAAEADPAAAISRAVVRRLEEFVRDAPDQWLWMHDRWKPLAEEPGAAAAVRAS